MSDEAAHHGRVCDLSDHATALEALFQLLHFTRHGISKVNVDPMKGGHRNRRVLCYISTANASSNHAATRRNAQQQHHNEEDQSRHDGCLILAHIFRNTPLMWPDELENSSLFASLHNSTCQTATSVAWLTLCSTCGLVWRHHSQKHAHEPTRTLHRFWSSI